VTKLINIFFTPFTKYAISCLLLQKGPTKVVHFSRFFFKQDYEETGVLNDAAHRVIMFLSCGPRNFFSVIAGLKWILVKHPWFIMSLKMLFMDKNMSN
jgi:hypothetical protein